MPATPTLSEPATFSLAYNPAQDLLRGQWPGPTPDADLRSHYAQLLAAARRHGQCHYWLLDMRARNWHTPGFGRWFGTEYAAAAHRALGGPLFVALVLGPQHRAAAGELQAHAVQCACTQHDVYPYLFDSEEAALEWLRHQQALAEGS